MTLGAGEGGEGWPHLGLQHPGLEGGHLLFGFLPLGCFGQFCTCFKKGSGWGRNGFISEEFL